MYAKYDYSSPTNSLFELHFPQFYLSDKLTQYVSYVEIYDYMLIIKMHEFLKDPSNIVDYTFKKVDGKLVKEYYEVPTLDKIKNSLFKKHKNPIILEIYDIYGKPIKYYYFTNPNIELYTINNSNIFYKQYHNQINDIILNVFFEKLEIKKSKN